MDGSIVLEVPNNATIGAVKRMSFESLGIDENALNSYDLIYQGDCLDEHKTIEDCNIKEDVDLKLIKNDIIVAYWC